VIALNSMSTNTPINILVCGASGALGNLIVQHLLKLTTLQKNQFHLIAATRSLDKLKHFADQGVELRHLNFDDKISLDKAFIGVHRLIIISTEDIGRRHIQHRNAIQAAEDANVQHVIYTSLVAPLPRRILFQDHFWTEVFLASSKLNWIVLRNQIYTEVSITNNLKIALESGVFYSASGNGKRAYIARDDCALAAAIVLLSPQGHEKMIYNITGSEALTEKDVAKLISEVKGKKVECVNLPFAEYMEKAKSGIPEIYHGITESYEKHAFDGHEELITLDYVNITGRQPTTFKTVLEQTKV